MISPKISQEKFEKNLRIQKKIGELYGYNLQNDQFSLAKPRQKEKKQKVVINQSIKPLQVKQKQIEPSQRFKQLTKQMEQLEIQKKISKMSEQQGSSNLNVPHLINTKIKEYNYLIDHKHFSHRKPAKSFFQNSTKNDDQLSHQSTGLLQQILVKQKDLQKTHSFMNRFRGNKQILDLYRDYSQSMTLKQKIKPNSSNIIKVPKIKGNLVQDLKSEVKIKNTQSTNLKGKERYEEQLDINSPFVEGKFIQSSQQLNQSIRRSRKQSQFIKQKLLKLNSKNQLDFTQPLGQESPKIQENQPGIMKTNMSEFSVAYNSLQSRMKENRSDQKECQKSYLSVALQKISPRYVKCEGSKFITKFDSNEVAISMIEGPKFQQKKVEPVIISSIKKVKIPSHLSEEDKMVMGLMIEEQSDSYYWTTCKNQKMNLMLKSHKPH